MPTTKEVDENRCPSKILFTYGVDAVEVVRCKDCKYLNIINKAPVYACCSKHNHTFYLWEEDTRKHFCSWGERKEDVSN